MEGRRGEVGDVTGFVRINTGVEGEREKLEKFGRFENEGESGGKGRREE